MKVSLDVVLGKVRSASSANTANQPAQLRLPS
jgi:hypothetical protein